MCKVLTRLERARQITIYSVYIIFFSVIQVTFSQYLSFRGQVADFMLVLVILTGYFFGSIDGMIVGVIVGVIRDSYSGSTLGVGVLVCLYAGVAASTLFRVQFHKRLALAFIQVSIVTFLYKFFGHLFFFLKSFFSYRGASYLSFQEIWLSSIIPQTFLNLLASVPLLLLLYYAGPYKSRYLFKKDGSMHEKAFAWKVE